MTKSPLGSKGAGVAAGQDGLTHTPSIWRSLSRFSSTWALILQEASPFIAWWPQGFRRTKARGAKSLRTRLQNPQNTVKANQRPAQIQEGGEHRLYLLWEEQQWPFKRGQGHGLPQQNVQVSKMKSGKLVGKLHFTMDLYYIKCQKAEREREREHEKNNYAPKSGFQNQQGPYRHLV